MPFVRCMDGVRFTMEEAAFRRGCPDWDIFSQGIVHFEKLYKGRVAHLQTALDKKTFLKNFRSY